ncbi:MAG: PIN domain-containing protein [Candidatus Latescibacteria bacterium]|nr:PIN domain-containing protein [Candidatus Latescibacterota bacterium]
MNILIDSSVWIDYFRSGKKTKIVDSLIDQNILCTNYLILSELLPSLRRDNHSDLINLLGEISKIPLNINWENIISYQTLCLSNGVNKVGIPDLIIIDNVIQNDLTLYSLDKHFDLIGKVIDFKIFVF